MLDRIDTLAQQREAFRADVLDGLSRTPKTLPSRWLYDDRGSELFEEITALPEYYPTRTETGILKERAREIAAVFPISLGLTFKVIICHLERILN